MKKIKKLILALIAISLMSVFASATIEKSWTTLSGGKQVLLTSDDDMAITQIIFFSAETVNDASISITYTEPANQIYQVINITRKNLPNGLVSGGSAKMKIKNSWLEKYVPNGSKVVLATPTGDYFEGELLFLRKGDEFSYYQAAIKKLEPFIIATNSKASTSTAGADTAASTTAADTTAKTNTESETKTTATPTTTGAEASCSDGVKNQDEADVDCGGNTCAKCASDKTCSFNANCESGFCYQGTCQTPTCSDGMKNQDESDVDCGGSCTKCGNDLRCASNNDCASGYCTAGYCKEIPAASKTGDTEAKTKISLPKIDLSNLKVSAAIMDPLKKNWMYIVGGIVAIGLIFAIIKMSGGRRKEPSVDELVKLYEEIKRI